MQLRIRAALPSQAATLTEIARAAKASWGYPAEWMAAWAAELQLTPQYVAAHPVFVATVDETEAGVCALEDRTDHWSLEHLWVLPAFQRHSVGKALVQHALRRAAAVRPGSIRIHSDPKAVDFYLGLGAELIGTLPAPMPGAPTRKLPILELVAAP